MRWRNTRSSYGLVAIALHWVVAIAVVGLFALGLWMVELSYYDHWYRRAPEIHKSIGILLFAAMLLRLAWKLTNPSPAAASGVGAREHLAARIAHGLLYALLFAIMISGYLISTADGRAIEVFGWFSVPATLSGIDGQEDIAGEVHLILAVTTIVIAAVHALAALKHHFLNRDRTLLRMLRPRD
jgi:cytochrome b561